MLCYNERVEAELEIDSIAVRCADTAHRPNRANLHTVRLNEMSERKIAHCNVFDVDTNTVSRQYEKEEKLKLSICFGWLFCQQIRQNAPSQFARWLA